MKIKILRGDSDNVGKEFRVIEYYDSPSIRFLIEGNYWVDKDDCVITELPEEFCVKRCDNKEKWKKYIVWLNKTYDTTNLGKFVEYLGYHTSHNVVGSDKPFGTEIHIDDMIKHIDYYCEPMVIESKEEFDMTTNEGRLAYAKKHYPIGTKYFPINHNGELDGRYSIEIAESTSNPRWYKPLGEYIGIHCGIGYIYANGKWAEIIKEENKMETQRLSRQGLKEIHSVACGNWKTILEGYSIRNSFEDYIELTQIEVDNMFKACCTKEQLLIVSNYLKQDDGSVNVTKNNINELMSIRLGGEYDSKSFLLSNHFNWEIKEDNQGFKCLIPTKKK